MMQEQQTIHLTFTPQRLDYIANVLGQRPWAEVAPILADIQQQIAQQQQSPVLGNGRDHQQAAS